LDDQISGASSCKFSAGAPTKEVIKSAEVQLKEIYRTA